MAMNLLPLGSLGAVESNGAVTFGIWLPWVSESDGNSVYVKIIHERDQFLQNIPPQPLGLHRVKVLKMTPDTLQVGPIEAIDGTPVIDIKPVLSESADW
jgi:hypothetical protein